MLENTDPSRGNSLTRNIRFQKNGLEKTREDLASSKKRVQQHRTRESEKNKLASQKFGLERHRVRENQTTMLEKTGPRAREREIEERQREREREREVDKN